MVTLLTGASGILGSYLLRELRCRDLPVVAWSGSQSGRLFGVSLRPVNLGDAEQVTAAFREARPEVVIHAGAIASVAVCFQNPETAHQVNTEGTRRLAELAAEAGARMLYVSTDLVFDGEKGSYREIDSAAPLSVYGRTKRTPEPAVLTIPGGVVARVSLLFGPSLTGRATFFDNLLTSFDRGSDSYLFLDEWRTPLSLATAAEGLVAVARSDFVGLLHLGGPERLSRLEMGQRLAAFLGHDGSTLVPVSRTSAAAEEPRPRDTSLDSTRWRMLFPRQPWPTWEEALRQMPLR